MREEELQKSIDSLKEETGEKDLELKQAIKSGQNYQLQLKEITDRLGAREEELRKTTDSLQGELAVVEQESNLLRDSKLELEKTIEVMEKELVEQRHLTEKKERELGEEVTGAVRLKSENVLLLSELQQSR